MSGTSRHRGFLGLRTTAGLIAGLALLFVAALAGLRATGQAREGGAWSIQTVEVLDQTDRLLGHLTDAETGQRGYLLTGDETYLEPHEQARATLADDLERLRAQTAHDPEMQERVRVLADLTNAKLEELDRAIELRRTQGVEAALAIVMAGHGKALMDRIARGR